MDVHTEFLLSKIEETRHEMIDLAHRHGYTSPNVLKCSQRLDDLLNMYRTGEKL